MQNQTILDREYFLTQPLKRFGYLVLLIIIALSILVNVLAIPTGPDITYVSNTTRTANITNRTTDQKGTITVVNLNSNQQDYKWKAYVGNVSGNLVLDDANSKSIYDWNLGTTTGEVYVSRSSSVNWGNVSCVNQSVIDNEQSFMGMTTTSRDNINNTFNYTAHNWFLIGAKNITLNSCKSTATYINDAAQTVDANAFFQEILLRDDISSSLIYSTVISNDHTSYDGVRTYDFQMIVAENESSSIPTNYYFFVELG